MSFWTIYFPTLAAFITSAVFLEVANFALNRFLINRQEKKYRALEKRFLEMQARGEEPTPEMMAELMPYLQQMPYGGMPVPPAPKSGPGESTGHYL